MRTRVTFSGMAEVVAAIFFLGVLVVCSVSIPRCVMEWVTAPPLITERSAMRAAFDHATQHPNPILGPFNLNNSLISAEPAYSEGLDAWLVTIRDKANNRERTILIDYPGRCKQDSFDVQF